MKFSKIKYGILVAFLCVMIVMITCAPSFLGANNSMSNNIQEELINQIPEDDGTDNQEPQDTGIKAPTNAFEAFAIAYDLYMNGKGSDVYAYIVASSGVNLPMVGMVSGEQIIKNRVVKASHENYYEQVECSCSLPIGENYLKWNYVHDDKAEGRLTYNKLGSGYEFVDEPIETIALSEFRQDYPVLSNMFGMDFNKSTCKQLSFDSTNNYKFSLKTKSPDVIPEKYYHNTVVNAQANSIDYKSITLELNMTKNYKVRSVVKTEIYSMNCTRAGINVTLNVTAVYTYVFYKFNESVEVGYLYDLIP